MPVLKLLCERLFSLAYTFYWHEYSKQYPFTSFCTHTPNSPFIRQHIWPHPRPANQLYKGLRTRTNAMLISKDRARFDAIFIHLYYGAKLEERFLVQVDLMLKTREKGRYATQTKAKSLTRLATLPKVETSSSRVQILKIELFLKPWAMQVTWSIHSLAIDFFLHI